MLQFYIGPVLILHEKTNQFSLLIEEKFWPHVFIVK